MTSAFAVRMAFAGLRGSARLTVAAASLARAGQSIAPRAPHPFAPGVAQGDDLTERQAASLRTALVEVTV